MVQFRRMTSIELRDAVRLSDATFRESDQTSMGQLFPFLFSDAAMPLSYGAFEEDGKLVSFMGVVLWTIKIGGATLRVASLGSVCTDPSARGKGYASRLLEEVQSFTRQAGASFLLVSGDRSLYTRAGCALFGSIIKFRMNLQQAESFLRNAEWRDSIREMRPDDLFAIQELAETREVRYQLGINELGMLLKAEAMAGVMKMEQRVLVKESGGKISGFAIIGVSSDAAPNGAVFEYAGESAEVTALFAEAVFRYGLQSMGISIPWHEKELQAQLAELPSTLENQPGTVCILSAEHLIEQLSPWLEQQADTNDLRLNRKENGSWLLTDGAGKPPVELSEEELIAFIFGRADRGAVSLPSAASVYQGVFPVPLPYTAGLCFI